MNACQEEYRMRDFQYPLNYAWNKNTKGKLIFQNVDILQKIKKGKSNIHIL